MFHRSGKFPSGSPPRAPNPRRARHDEYPAFPPVSDVGGGGKSTGGGGVAHGIHPSGGSGVHAPVDRGSSSTSAHFRNANERSRSAFSRYEPPKNLYSLETARNPVKPASATAGLRRYVLDGC